MNSQKDQFVLSLSTKTWVRDSHGLFDYESNQTKNLNAILAESINIIRNKNDIKTLGQISDLKSNDEFIFRVKHDLSNEYFLENEIPILTQPTELNINNLSNKIWYVLKNDPYNSNQSNQTVVNCNDEYYLCKNDVIKLGRVKYALNEINIPSKNDNIEKEIPKYDQSKYDIDNLNKNTQPVFDFIFKAKSASEYTDIPDDEKICKICYSEENDKENPLVHLCNCNGGLRFSHYLCIKKWMETKLTTKENIKNTVKTYNIKSFNCEICKTPYPFKFEIQGFDEPFELIELQKPVNCDYIILESLNQMKENCNIKSIHVVQLTGEDLIIGRGHESDIRINDISVSRNHAKLKYNEQEGTLLLSDLKSKFGTLILIKKPLKIKEKKIQLQIGRTYIEGCLITMEHFQKIKNEKKQKQKQKTENQLNNQNTEEINNNAMDIEEYPTK
jgi:hypothetical protein